MDNELIAAILDNECNPQNPYIIKLHCADLSFYWVRTVAGYWIDDKWVDGVYIIHNIQIER